jgi:predicted nucleic acid-binding protein
MMNGILVDTSVWVAHFRARNNELCELLECDAVLIHPMVIAELACGTPPSRAHTLSYLASLQHTQQASLGEVTSFIEREKLYGEGCGMIDMILLASTLITPNAKLWTLDKRLLSLTDRFNIIYHPKLH